MKLGAMNNPERDILKEIKTFGEFGFDFVEITVEGPRAYPEILLNIEKEIKEILDSYNMFVIVHVPWFFEIAHPYDNVRKAYFEEMLKIIEIAQIFNSEIIGVHLNKIKGRFENKLKKNISALKELEKACEDNGILLCIENLDIHSFDVDDYHEIFNEINAGFILDIGHANVGSKKGEEIFRFIREFKDRLKHVHAHDNFGREDLHLPIGAGNIDWEKVIKELRKFYDNTVTLEIHSRDIEYLKISREKFLELLR
ncbi:MAG: hypothetical protein DRN88_05835 [Candidatus Hydrothermarchaeota archaeon]|nr:MAG: hypothetical protein DRN88_05835 [Candidatus Hydrothermarchaeota archaeon]